MEQLIQTLIVIHASLGGLALIGGLVSMSARKGQKLHKKSGLVFYYSMVLCGLSAMTVALLPKHESPFLFAIGIFSLYFVLSGKQALKLKEDPTQLTLNKLISMTMLFAGILMIVLPLILTNSINIILLVFALVGIVFSIRDLIVFNQPERLKKVWLKLHLGKMLGGYISASTAFVVVNGLIPGIYGWFIPSILGSLVIAYWIRKLNNGNSANE